MQTESYPQNDTNTYKYRHIELCALTVQPIYYWAEKYWKKDNLKLFPSVNSLLEETS